MVIATVARMLATEASFNPANRVKTYHSGPIGSGVLFSWGQSFAFMSSMMDQIQDVSSKPSSIRKAVKTVTRESFTPPPLMKSLPDGPHLVDKSVLDSLWWTSRACQTTTTGLSSPSKKWTA